MAVPRGLGNLGWEEMRVLGMLAVVARGRRAMVKVMEFSVGHKGLGLRNIEGGMKHTI